MRRSQRASRTGLSAAPALPSSDRGAATPPSRCRTCATRRCTRAGAGVTPYCTAALPNDSTPDASSVGSTIGLIFGEVGAADLVAPLNEHVAQVLLGRRVAELAGLDDGADQLVRERHHPPRRPERVVVAHLDVGGRRRPGLPGLGVELVAFEAADGGYFS